jgi:hypothetical protein
MMNMGVGKPEPYVRGDGAKMTPFEHGFINAALVADLVGIKRRTPEDALPFAKFEDDRRYLEQLGIAERPLDSGVSPKRRQCPPSGRPKSTIGVFNDNDLAKLRGLVLRRFHDDEERLGLTVSLKRVGRAVARIDCATEDLAWDAERICAGIRFKRGAA